MFSSAMINVPQVQIPFDGYVNYSDNKRYIVRVILRIGRNFVVARADDVLK